MCVTAIFYSMIAHPSPLISRIRARIASTRWLVYVLASLLVLSHIVPLCAMGMGNANQRVVQLCTSHGMVNVTLDGEPVADGTSIHQSGMECCGCCPIFLLLPVLLGLLLSLGRVGIVPLRSSGLLQRLNLYSFALARAPPSFI